MFAPANRTVSPAHAAPDPIEYFADWGISDLDREYLAFHYRRYRVLVAQVQDCLKALRGQLGAIEPSLIDVGPAWQTALIAAACPELEITTIGYRNTVVDGYNHIDFDLNRLVDRSAWPAAGPAHVLVAAELVEHLTIGLDLTLRFFEQLVVPGGFVIVQTPNAAALHKRLQLLFGRNPYDLLDYRREDHFREFTVSELEEVGRANGLIPVSVRCLNYFDRGTAGQRLYNAAVRFLPGTLRQGITIVYQRQP